MEEETLTTDEIVANLKDEKEVPDAQPASKDFNETDPGNEQADPGTTSAKWSDRP